MRNHTSILDAAGQQECRLFRSTVPENSPYGAKLIKAELKKVAPSEWEIRLRHRGREALSDGRNLSFEDWWKELVVNNDEIKLSREDIIRIMRDKNGGAHFDSHVTDKLLAAAIRGEIGAFNFQNSETDRIEVVPGGLEYSVRQIATELWYSLELRDEIVRADAD